MTNKESFSDYSTPMMSQYLAIKSEYKDCILFYRLGDFYEMFFEDAITASQILNIALTKRGKHASQDIPMCGVPFHSSEYYVTKLIEQGFKVAICEQIETPEEAKKRGYKSVVKREVVRVITSGTLIEENLLVGKTSNYLISISKIKEEIALAWVEVSTGKFGTIVSNLYSLSSDIARLDPKEILIADKLYNDKNIAKFFIDYKKYLTVQVASFFDVQRAVRNIKSFYKINNLDSFGNFLESQLSACGAIIEYLMLTHKNNLPKLNIPKNIKNELFMVIDQSTRRNLEITQNIHGETKDSLLNVLDNTVTNLGARLLNQYITLPLLDAKAITNRQNSVEFFYNNIDFSELLRNELKTIGDIERSLLKLSMGYGSVKDMIILKNSFNTFFRIREIIEISALNILPQIIHYINYLKDFDQIYEELNSALKDDINSSSKEGGFVKEGYNFKLDELYNIEENTHEKLIGLKNQYISLTGINNIKINNNNLLGYYIEVSSSNASKFDSNIFIHRQSLLSSVRFTTNELKDIENDLIHSKELIANLEKEIFESLRQIIINNQEKIALAADSIAILDVQSSLALIAKKRNYVKPIIDNSMEFNIKDGRHPVIELILSSTSGENFIPNDCHLDESSKIWLMTGPNMAGKSTFLRQNALIAIMAQIGSFVPASYAHIGIIDRIFSRVGAGDDLARGRSTFMVEMIETATILNHATSNSFVILDEIGRGTSTYDGVSIAWSCLEYLHNNLNTRTLFATHYHELAKLESMLPKLSCYTMEVKEWEDKIIFLHKVVAGNADKSYGIYVAKLAGIPHSILDRANELLKDFEKKEGKKSNANSKSSDAENIFKTYLNNININHITPIEALEHINKLKQMIN